MPLTYWHCHIGSLAQWFSNCVMWKTTWWYVGVCTEVGRLIQIYFFFTCGMIRYYNIIHILYLKIITNIYYVGTYIIITVNTSINKIFHNRGGTYADEFWLFYIIGTKYIFPNYLPISYRYSLTPLHLFNIFLMI